VGTEHDGVPDGHRQRRLLLGLHDDSHDGDLDQAAADVQPLPLAEMLETGAGGASGGDSGGGARRRELGLTGRRKSTKKKGEVSIKDVQLTFVDEKLGFPELVHGWGVPTATDISLAWVIAMQVFPKGHPAIEFLLLLAVADDAIGLGIIAIAYPDPHHPVEPVWMLLILVGVGIAYALRKAGCMRWYLYVSFGGFPAWVGLIKAALHPALALVFIVPFLPSECPPDEGGTSTNLNCKFCGGFISCFVIVAPRVPPKEPSKGGKPEGHGLHQHHAHPPLHAFEHALKVPIEMGMFFFTLANAGVQLNGVGPLTIGVFAGLAVGKMAGITLLVLLASVLRIAPIPDSMTMADVLMVSAVASVGLTVALFVSGEAYEHEQLQAESKLGALLSGGMGILCVGVSNLPFWPHRRGAAAVTAPLSTGDSAAAVAHGSAVELERASTSAPVAAAK